MAHSLTYSFLVETNTAQLSRALVFAAVVEAGSFTGGAARLGCSKAHASKQIRAIEDDLGVQLLHRTTRRLDLTDAGRVYADYCVQVRDTLLEADRAVSAMRTEVAGTIRMTAPPAFGETFLPELMVAFQRAYPAVRLEVDLSVQARDLLGDSYDVAIRSARTFDEHLVARLLGTIRDLAVASPSFVAEHGLPREPAHLAALPCVINGHFSDDQHWVFERDGATHAVSLNGPLRINQYTAIRRIAIAGAGIARLPSYLVTNELAAGDLVPVCPGYDLVAAPTFLLYPQRTTQPLRSRVFVDFVQHWFAAPERAALFC